MSEQMNEYRLGSCSLMYTPGMMQFWINGYRTQPEIAFWQVSMGFSMLPAALIADVLSERCPYEVDGDTVVIKWAKPLGEFRDYVTDKRQLTHQEIADESGN